MMFKSVRFACVVMVAMVGAAACKPLGTGSGPDQGAVVKDASVTRTEEATGSARLWLGKT
jgi:hypothetical protein